MNTEARDEIAAGFRYAHFNGDANTGRVGIGTADPNEILHVIGNIALSGNVTMSGAIVQENWIAPPLLNGWVNFGSGFNPAGYFRDKQGIVHVRDMLKKTDGSLVREQPLFTVPAGYQPEFRELYLMNSQDAFGRCDIDANGNVLTILGASAFFSLDGISFRTVLVPST